MIDSDKKIILQLKTANTKFQEMSNRKGVKNSDRPNFFNIDPWWWFFKSIQFPISFGNYQFSEDINFENLHLKKYVEFSYIVKGASLDLKTIEVNLRKAIRSSSITMRGKSYYKVMVAWLDALDRVSSTISSNRSKSYEPRILVTSAPIYLRSSAEFIINL